MKKFVNNILAAAMMIASIASVALHHAQTDMDAIMMNKKQFCQGLTYDYSSWDHYWEGTFKRDNENLGTVSSQMLMYMPNYGITNNLNVMASVPYVWTKASQGTLHGMTGSTGPFRICEMETPRQYHLEKINFLFLLLVVSQHLYQIM